MHAEHGAALLAHDLGDARIQRAHQVRVGVVAAQRVRQGIDDDEIGRRRGAPNATRIAPSSATPSLCVSGWRRVPFEGHRAVLEHRVLVPQREHPLLHRADALVAEVEHASPGARACRTTRARCDRRRHVEDHEGLADVPVPEEDRVRLRSSTPLMRYSARESRRADVRRVQQLGRLPFSLLAAPCPPCRIGTTSNPSASGVSLPAASCAYWYALVILTQVGGFPRRDAARVPVL
jgi:hypothetical protein